MVSFDSFCESSRHPSPKLRKLLQDAASASSRSCSAKKSGAGASSGSSEWVWLDGLKNHLSRPFWIEAKSDARSSRWVSEKNEGRTQVRVMRGNILKGTGPTRL